VIIWKSLSELVRIIAAILAGLYVGFMLGLYFGGREQIKK
jgi:hypothetical protein